MLRFLSLLLLFVAMSNSAWAKIYMYVDADGHKAATGRLEDVPAGAKVTSVIDLDGEAGSYPTQRKSNGGESSVKTPSPDSTHPQSIGEFGLPRPLFGKSEQQEAAEKAENVADELRDEMEQAAVRTQNNIYLGVLLIFTAGFVTYVIRKSNKEEIMRGNQKFGVAVIMGSILLIIMAIMISGGWDYRHDFLQNLMTSLRIKLFAEGECPSWALDCSYAVDFPTKYAVLACLCSAAYGFTTYLGITPVPKIKVGTSDLPSENGAQRNTTIVNPDFRD